MGTTVATDGSITGAAANIPCLNELTQRNGVPIIRDEARMDGMDALSKWVLLTQSKQLRKH